jgi:hypothetical protein
MSRQSNTSGFDLGAGNPAGFSCLQTKFTKSNGIAAFGAAAHATPVMLSKLRSFRH